jgi:HNH endonuclease
MSPRPQGPVEDYFIPEPNSGCWIWLGGLGKDGYGMAWDVNEKKTLGAHRWVYMLLVGPIPEGQKVLHRCDNPCCVNPEHLFLGTTADNNADMRAKNRHGHGTTHGMNRIPDSDVLAIRESKGRHQDIGAKFGVSKSLVTKIKARDLWKHL